MSSVRLGDHANLIRGITFKPMEKCDPNDEGAVVCMRTKNVQVTLDASDLIAVPNSLAKNPEKMLSEGDILVSSANSWNLVGKCCQVPKLQYPSTAGGFISILRPKTKKLKSSYLYRWFSSNVVQKKLRSFANQTTNISNLDHKRTLELQIPLPSPAEQRRIAGILDAADALRAKRREALAQLDTLLQSTFLDMFGDPVTNLMGWDERPLGKLVQQGFRNGLSPSTKGTLDGEVLTLSAITRGRFDFAAKKVARFDHSPSPLQQLSTDTFLICRGNGNMRLVGTGAYPDRSSTRVCFPDTMIGVAIDPKVLAAAYLQHLWRTQRVRRQIERGARTTNGTHKVNQRLLSSIVFPVPPVALQLRFAAIVESVEEQRCHQRTHLTELDTLFASLQSRAFRGDL